MSLRLRIDEDYKTAMKARDKERVAAIRGITAKIKDLEVAARSDQRSLTDEDLIPMLRGMIKSRSESADMYRKAERHELAAQEEYEIKLIQTYLPPEMDEATLTAEIEEAIVTVKAASIKDIGKVLGALREKFGASLDMSRVSSLVRARLS